MNRDLKDHFETKYSIENGCWIWHGRVDGGVPMFPVNRRYRSARQVAATPTKMTVPRKAYRNSRSFARGRNCGR